MLRGHSSAKPQYNLNRNGEFIIENYNLAKPFANFFPGIAGKYGIPMWVFYVNRGQGIASFGTKDKDHAILEFFPANRAWQRTPLHGFRTFVKVCGKKEIFYEPFYNGFVNFNFTLQNRMVMTSYDLRLEEYNRSLGLRINIEYFTIPNDSYSALVRKLTVTNASKQLKKIKLLDGLPQIMPFGLNNWLAKEMSRTIEAWVGVENLKEKAPFYKLVVDPADRPEVIHISEGNFYISFINDTKKPCILTPLIDPADIFGPVTDFHCPYNFLTAGINNPPKTGVLKSKTPSAFSYLEAELRANQQETIYSLIGYARNVGALNALIPKIMQKGYLLHKQQENRNLINELQQDISTQSSCAEFDLYAKQTYLDNILRGGYPISFKNGNNKMLFYLYSRKHGDLERDYNRFQIQPTYFSQGNGNYRDVNQNRRLDVWFNPEVGYENIVTFLNLLQTDGFNPLVVKGSSFTLTKPNEFLQKTDCLSSPKQLGALSSFLSKPFTPGDLILFLQETGIKLKISYDEFLDILLPDCQKIQDCEYGEGFWTDHWVYNLDLIENYLGVYPEKSDELMFTLKTFTYCDNSEVVKPRAEKYLLHNNLPRQLNSLAVDNAKKELIRKRHMPAHIVRSGHGNGPVYYTNLINKLLCLAANKLASLDPFGIGIEMEANKPNWYDALNGLPALFGSSSCETFELKRLILFIQNILKNSNRNKLSITSEIYGFLSDIDRVIQEYFASVDNDKDYICWDRLYSIKENYRKDTLLGLSGEDKETAVSELVLFMDNALKKVNQGLDKAFDKEKKLYCTYFINEVVEYEITEKPFIKPKKFSQIKLPFFLESQMHALRIINTPKDAKFLYAAVRRSQLYDKTLKMYKVTSSLARMPEEIGRCRVFAPGWLENESIWLHMEYKYMLEVLKTGLFDEFYADFKNVLVPFQKPDEYGRSILENSSFIVSSAFADKKLRGNGFVARLSGSTAEFLQIWLIMNAGKRPFYLDKNGNLNLRFSPALPGWLFDKKTKTYTFNFLSKTKITYHNPKLCNTYGKIAVKPVKIGFRDKDNLPVEIKSPVIPSLYARQIRDRQIDQIDIYLG